MGIYHKEYCEALAARNNMKVNMLYIDRQKLSAPMAYMKMKKRIVAQESGYRTYIKRMLDFRSIDFDWQMRRYERTLLREFRRYIRQNGKPDVIHAQVSIPAGYAAASVGKKYGIPVLITEHASYFERFFEGKEKKYDDFVLENAFLTAVSPFMVERFAKMGIHAELLPNLIDTSAFVRPRKKIKGLRLITVSALRRAKRIDDIIEAVKILVEEEKIENVSLTVVGDGYEEALFKERCHELEMDSHVDFVGRKNKEEIAEFLASANIFVLASEYETFGIPVIEAFAAGIPVVATKCRGPEEFIDEKCGVLVEVKNPHSLAQGILEVYRNLERYDSVYLREKANTYSPSKVLDTAMEIYEKLLAENREKN